MSFRIDFENLWTYDDGGSYEERLPLVRLSDSGGHVHGRLRITVAGSALPYLGFFGPDDVCFNEWAHELQAASRQLGAESSSRYIYDEGEQGQPAFLFEREGPQLFVSVVDSMLSGAGGLPEWQRISCFYADFHEAVHAFLSAFRACLVKEAGANGESWYRRIMRE